MYKLEKSEKVFGLVVCGLAPLFYLYVFFLRVMPSAMTSHLMGHFHLTAAGLGIMLAFYYYGYGPAQVVVGLMFDRFSVRLLMALSILLCAVGVLIFAFTDNVTIASSGRFIVGFASAFSFIGPLVLAARWLPSKYFAAYAGILQGLGSLGAVAAERPIAMIVKDIGWRSVMVWGAVIGVILALIFWLVIRDYPKGKYLKLKPTVSKGIFKQLWAVINKPHTWWIGLYAMFIWAPAAIFATLWGVPFLERVYNFTPEVAAGAVSFVWVGVAVGSILIGWWSDHVKRRCFPAALSAVIGLIGAVVVIYWHHQPIALLDIFLFIFGCGVAGQALSFAIVKDNSKNVLAGTAASFNNMLIFVGAGMIFQPLVGVILHSLSTPGIPYTKGIYTLSLSIIPLSFIIAFIIAVFFVKETDCQPTYLDKEAI